MLNSTNGFIIFQKDEKHDKSTVLIDLLKSVSSIFFKPDHKFYDNASRTKNINQMREKFIAKQ